MLAGRLWRLGSAPGRWAARCWSAALLATALAAAVGGSNHGFGPLWSGSLRSAAWLATYELLGLANLGLLAGLALAVAQRKTLRVLLLAATLRFGLYVVLLALRREFRFVVYDLAVTLLALAAYAWYAQLSGRVVEARWLFGAVLVSAAAAGGQRGRLAVHPLFNHNDLFHVGQMVSLYLLYRGGRFLRDRAADAGVTDLTAAPPRS